MGRTRYIVAYDISHPRRLRKVARTLEGYGTRLQLSVFECPLDGVRLAKAKAQLAEQINHEEDQVLFVALGPAAGDANLHIEALGKPYSARRVVTII
jgi:CRISPR-associated protein Cas2